VAIPPRLVITASQVLCHHFPRDKGRLYQNQFSRPPFHRLTTASTFPAYHVPAILSLEPFRCFL